MATFQFRFTDLALMILNEFLPKYVHFNGQTISGASEEFSITSHSKMQKSIF